MKLYEVIELIELPSVTILDTWRNNNEFGNFRYIKLVYHSKTTVILWGNGSHLNYKNIRLKNPGVTPDTWHQYFTKYQVPPKTPINKQKVIKLIKEEAENGKIMVGRKTSRTSMPSPERKV